MPLNLLKKYPELLEFNQFGVDKRKESLIGVFKRDIADNKSFSFRGKQVRPTKKEGESSMLTLFNHLTTRSDEDEKGKKLRSRSFEMNRSVRLHWVKHHIYELKKDDVFVFSYKDRVDRRDVIRTYIYDDIEKYVIVLEPQRSGTDYYLLMAYYLDENYGVKQMRKKYKNRLEEVY